MEKENKTNDAMVIAENCEPFLVERLNPDGNTAERLYQTQKAISALQGKKKEE